MCCFSQQKIRTFCAKVVSSEVCAFRVKTNKVILTLSTALASFEVWLWLGGGLLFERKTVRGISHDLGLATGLVPLEGLVEEAIWLALSPQPHRRKKR